MSVLAILLKTVPTTCIFGISKTIAPLHNAQAVQYLQKLNANQSMFPTKDFYFDKFIEFLL